MRLRLVHDVKTRGEEIAALVILAAGAIGAVWILAGLPTPRCLFHTVTGLPCLTCGATRSARSFLAGDVAAAFGWNPMVFAAGVFCAAFVAYVAVVAPLRLPRLRIVEVSRADARWIRALALLAITANWIYVGLHFSGRA